MTDNDDKMTELDLLAYADGRLDGDPERKAQVEAYLRANPEDAARVEDYRAQNDMIRSHYGAVLAEPVPERLKRILESRSGLRPSRLRTAALAATVLLSIAMSGVTGWWIGKNAEETGTVIPSFIEQALSRYDVARDFRTLPTAPSLTSRPLTGQKTVVGSLQHGLSNRVRLSVGISNLTPNGFTIENKRVLTKNGEETLRLDFAAPDGRSLSLFLGARNRGKAPETSVTEKGDTTAVYWHDGPFAFGLVSRMKSDEILRIADTIRLSTQFHRRIFEERPSPGDGKGPGLAVRDATPPKPLPRADVLGGTPPRPQPRPKAEPNIVNDL